MVAEILPEDMPEEEKQCIESLVLSRRSSIAFDREEGKRSLKKQLNIFASHLRAVFDSSSITKP